MYKSFIFYLILLNSIWDLLCGFSIIFNIYPFSIFHNYLWKYDYTKYNNNYILEIRSKHLFAYLIILWGFMRFIGLILYIKELIIFYYIFEGLIIFNEIFIYNNMKTDYGLLVGSLSFLFAYLAYYL